MNRRNSYLFDLNRKFDAYNCRDYIMWIYELPFISSSTRCGVSLLASPVLIYVSINPEMPHQLVISLVYPRQITCVRFASGCYDFVRGGVCSPCYQKPEAKAARKKATADKKDSRGTCSTPGCNGTNHKGRYKCVTCLYPRKHK